MGFDGNGNYTRTNGTQTGSSLWQNRAAIAPATISAAEHDAEMNDVANALTACIKADGSKTATNNQPMGGFKHTGVANASLSNEYATLGQVQTGLSVNDLVVSANNTGTALRVTQIGTGEALRVEDSANPDTTPTVITAAGDVGIGIAAPTTKLQVEGTVLVNVNSAGDGVRITQTGAGNAFVVEDSTNPDSTPFVIAADGKVGIATTTPKEQVQLGSTATLSQTDSVGSIGSVLAFNSYYDGATKAITTGNRTAAVELGNSGGFLKATTGTQTADTAVSTYNTYIRWGSSTDFVTLSTANTERLRVTSGGNVGIGTTGPTFQLQLSTDSAAKPTTNTWTIASDGRIKTNIAPYAKGLAEVRQIEPITYDYNGKGGIAAGPGGVSIIAQDLQSIFPECIGSYRAKLEESDEEETDILNYNGHAITFALINAIKELANKIDSLEQEVSILKGA